MYKLVLVHKGKIQKNIPLRPGSIIIGRKADSDIHLAEKLVSGHHAELIVKNSGVTLKDLGSTNGTRVNGEDITETKLQTGDQVSIGDYKLVFITEHGDSEDPDATVMVSSGHSSTAGHSPGKHSTVHNVVKSIVVVILIALLAGWFTNIL